MASSHSGDVDGSPILVLPRTSTVVATVRSCTDLVGATIDATDVTPAPVTDRIRHRVLVTGWLRELTAGRRRAHADDLVRHDERPQAPGRRGGSPVDDAVMLRMDVLQVLIAPGGQTSGAIVELADFASAEPDPLLGLEGDLIGHLWRDHQAELALLAGQLPAELRSSGERIVPVTLDRYGIVLRVIGPAAAAGSAASATAPGHQDVRLPFSQPVDEPAELPDRMHDLLRWTVPRDAPRR